MLQPDNSFVMVFAYAKTTPSPSGAELQVKQMLAGRSARGKR